jgi:hypothetical protein
MKKAAFAIILAGTLLLAGCSSWNTIIAGAQAIAELAGTVDPGLSGLSTLAVQLLGDAENAVSQYNQNKNATTLAAAQSALEAIDTQLPNVCNQLQVSATVKQRAQAAVMIILDYVDSLAIPQPELAAQVVARRAARAAAPAPAKRLSKKEIEERWRYEVCAGDEQCAGLIKPHQPGFWHGVGNAIGEAKWGGAGVALAN